MREIHISGALALLLALPCTAAPLAPFSAERSWQIQRLAPPSIAPDGNAVVAAVTRLDSENNKTSTDLVMWSIDGTVQRQLTTHPAAESAPQFSPDGKLIAFVAQREGDTAAQIYVLPVDGGEASRVTSMPTGVAQVKWFPDGKRLAFLSRVWVDLDGSAAQAQRQKERGEAKSSAQIWDGGPVYFWDTWIDDRQLHVFSTGLGGGEPVNLTLGSGLQLPRTAVQLEQSQYDISPDGKEIAFVADSDPAINVTNIDLFVVAIDASAARNLSADSPAADGAPLYSPDGRYLAFAQQRIKGFYGDIRRLMVHDRASGKTRQVVPDSWDRSADGLVWSADSKQLFGAIDDHGSVRVHAFALDGSVRKLGGESSFGALAVASERGTVIGLRQSFVEPPTLVRIDPRSGEATKLSTINDALLAGTAMGTFESVSYRGADGAQIQMWVNYPPGFDRSKKYPLLLLIHGGPHNAITNGMQFRWNAQVFGSWGYVTAWPNFHGSTGFGNAFTDAINPQQDDLPYRDVIAAADWLREKPWIDGERMLAAGASYGGYLGAIVLGREHPFKALVVHAGVYNWYTQMGADYAFETPRFGGYWTPEQQQVFKTGSPHYGAANFNTPTLVTHGQRDLRVPVNHGVELYHALLQKGVPTRLVYFSDENHWILKPGNSLVWYEQVRQWLAKYGGGDVIKAAAD